MGITGYFGFPEKETAGYFWTKDKQNKFPFEGTIGRTHFPAVNLAEKYHQRGSLDGQCFREQKFTLGLIIIMRHTMNVLLCCCDKHSIIWG